MDDEFAQYAADDDEFSQYAAPEENESQPKKASSLHGALQKMATDYIMKSFESVFKDPAISKGVSEGLGFNQGAVNTISSAANLIPEGIQAATGKDIGRIPKLDLSKYAANEILFKGGELLGGAAVPFGGATKLAGKVPKLSNAMKNALAGAGVGFAANEGNRKTGAALGAGLGAGITKLTEGLHNIPAIKEGLIKVGEKIPGIRGAIETFRAPKIAEQEVKKATETVNKVADNLFNQEKSIDVSKRNAAKLINEDITATNKNVSESSAKLEQLFPDKPESVARKETYDLVKQGRESLKQSFDKRYKSFNETSGVKPVNRPFQTEDIKPYSDLFKKSTKEAAEGLIGKNKELSILDPTTKEPIKLKIPGPKSTASDYIDFMRETRDAARIAKQEGGTGSNATDAQKQAYNRQAEQLDKLSADAKKRAYEVLSDEEIAQFEQIQSDYKKKYVPFFENNALYNAWAKGIVNEETLFDQLMQPANQGAYEHLATDKKFGSTMLSNKLKGSAHPVSKNTVKGQAEAIKTFLKDNKDLAVHLSPEQAKALSNHLSLANTIDKLGKIKAKINSSEFQRALNEADLESIKGYSPKARQLMMDIESKQKTIPQLKEQARKAGITLEEAKEVLAKKEKLKESLKTKLQVAAGIIGAGGALKTVDKLTK